MDAVALRVFVYEHLLSYGAPPASGTIAAHFGTDAYTVRHTLASLKIGKTILVSPDDGEIWMAGPFSATPTPYRVVGSRASWWANCAWDMYGVVALVNEPVHIDTQCTESGESMSLDADPATGGRSDAIVHFLVPARRWYDDVGFT